jgi:hypothetical protein
MKHPDIQATPSVERIAESDSLEHMVRTFFEWLVTDGYYCLTIDGENFLLESQADVDRAIAKLATAPAKVRRYRQRQAEAWSRSRTNAQAQAQPPTATPERKGDER